MAGIPAWKSDFPVSSVDDDLVTRREFTKSLVWVSCAAFASTGALLGAAARQRSAAPPTALKVADVDELAIGGSKVFSYPTAEDPCLLVRLDTDSFVAVHQLCTHLGCPVLYEHEDRVLHCPCHEGYFSATDGSVLSGPPPRALPWIGLERRGRELWAVGVRS